MIAQIGLNVDANGHRVVEGRGLVLAPGFVDPHVHLRTPGREDEETIASGTAAAAAGGFCAILAMPNTEPVVDSAAVLGSLIETAREEAEVPVGFLAAITKGQEGKELTEMAELADAGAAGFSDDGRPVVAPGLMRRALQYHAITGLPGRAALRGADALPRRARCTRARSRPSSASPATRRSPRARWSRRDLALAAYEGQPIHLLHLSARESVDELRRAQAAGVRATGEATPHHLVLTDEAVRSLDANLKMNPPLRSADDRKALVDAVRDGTITVIATDHAPHALHEKDVPFEEAPFGVTGLETAFASLNTHLVGPGLLTLADADRADVRRAGARLRARAAADRGRRDGEPRPARPRGGLARRRRRLPLALGELVAARRDAQGQGAADGRRRPGARYSGMTRLPGARGRHGLPRQLGRAPRAPPSARRSSRPR